MMKFLPHLGAILFTIWALFTSVNKVELEENLQDVTAQYKHALGVSKANAAALETLKAQHKSAMEHMQRRVLEKEQHAASLEDALREIHSDEKTSTCGVSVSRTLERLRARTKR